MRLINKVTNLKTDLSESRVKMALIADHYETHGKLISLDEVPEEMYGKELPIAKGRKSKRKDLSEEEYLAEERPSKKSKPSTFIRASEEGGSGMQPISEEQVEGVLGKRTRESQEG